jgi:DNA-binding transcriptional ArsR family regulator
MKTAKKVVNPQQIKSLGSPVRLAIVEALESSPPLSVASLARRIGDTPDGLYYHLRILERLNLVKKEGELVYLRQPLMLLGYNTADKKNRLAVVQVARALLRSAYRYFVAAFRPGVRVSGRRRELWVGQRAARLTPSQLERLNALVWDALLTFSEGPAEDERNPVYVFTFALSPYSK